MKRRPTVFMALMVFSLTASLPSTWAETVNIVIEPPSDWGIINVGDTLTLVYGTNFSDAVSSLTIILINYSKAGFSFKTFNATIDGIDVTGQFGLVDERGMLMLNCSSMTPANGALRITVSFKAVSITGDSLFSWRALLTAFQQPPNPPTFVDKKGVARVSVQGTPITVSADAVWNEASDTVDLTATAECDTCGIITTGSAVYEIFETMDGSSIISGSMTYNGEEGRWEALNIGTRSLDTGPYYALIQVTDPAGHSSIDQAGFRKGITYTVIITTSGLPTESYATRLYVDGAEQGTPYVWDGEPRQLTFNTGEQADISVDEYVEGGAGTRYYCVNTTTYTADSGDQNYTFNYVTQYLLTLSTNEGEVTSEPSSPNGFYNKGEVVRILAIVPTDGIEDMYVWNGWAGTGTISYSGVDNPATITMNSPINETALIAREGTGELNISHLSISPTDIGVDEPVTIGVTVTNIGDQAGDYTVSLKIDGVARARNRASRCGCQ